jgi:cytochrome P450
MTDFEALDFFKDESVAADPYSYFDHLLDTHRVWREPHHRVFLITGFEEALEVLRDSETFSACNAVGGPFAGFPVELEGENVTDVSDLIDRYEASLVQGDQITTMDPPKHTNHRGLLMGLITPKRLKENEAFMWRLADRQLDEILPRGEVDLISDYAQPYTLLVVADLLGVPESDHESLVLGRTTNAVAGDTGEAPSTHNALARLYDYFVDAIEDRRRHPREDVLTGLAEATFQDGTLPDPLDAARIASNLFAAGQETTVRLMSNSFQLLTERPELQQLLRGERDRIPAFVEEVLRYDSPIKGNFRLARVPTTIGGVDIPAGATVMMLYGAANHDPRRFECPREFRIDRENARYHMAFGHGIHTCPGAPLARSEARVTIERFLDRTTDIRLSETVHGPAEARRFEYLPSYMIRGVRRLQLEFTPVS